ncbi:hypothetical protein M406DRAFT_344868 [Cryphonectria parasitica EP155]|uniref:Uncharacterized protein n=1 Tax=Cryphonectria parasitica (strain ATCC 38755 / EP155) TaxID=660469 RepID=A0A9P5CT99_CRYP1|nr:uncharacterized protein M406DRAFT_344868 [Cryphonectria parasitica EP155]KAF3768935.1 hypothetical protein M406DRAFT_344868 [Cryphonectria parasitica EP155]
MPSLTQSFPRKRRRDESDIEEDLHLTISQGFHDRYPHDCQHQHHGSSPKKPTSLLSPLSKKIRMTTASTSEWQTDEDQRQALPTPSCRQHRSLSAASTKHSPPKASAPTNLSPCHICHRRPTKKTELDSFADCEGCGERTCYVCIRECLGWRAHEGRSRGGQS